MFTLINPWAVLVAAVVTYLIGWAWYSPILWQKPWMAARGDTGENWETEGKKEMPKIMAYGLVNTVLMVFVLAVFMALIGIETLAEAVQVSLLMAFGFAVTIKFSDMLYTSTPPHWGRRAQTLFIIDSGYLIVLYAVASAIIFYMS
jgi:hypothetical protein